MATLNVPPLPMLADHAAQPPVVVAPSAMTSSYSTAAAGSAVVNVDR